MTEREVSVAEAKKHLSDLLGRVAYRGERITISKRGKPMAVLIPAAESESEESLAKIEGWLDPADPFFEVIGEIVSDRDKHSPRLFEVDRE